jgi:hypothetical protein
VKHCEEVFHNLDWALLREQKDYCENEAANNDAAEIYEALLSLIDYLQDAAVLDGIATEDEVYGKCAYTTRALPSPDEEGIDD